MSRMIPAILSVCVLSPLASAQPAGRPRSHVDLRHGFGFVVPEAALAQPAQGSGMIAKWVALDAGTGAVAWTLSFYQARPEDTGKVRLAADDLRKYSDTLRERLERETQLQVDSLRVVTVAGKGAIDVTGSFLLGKRGRSELRQFRRQVWVLTGPQDFLVVKLEGPLTDAKALTALSDSVLETLRVMEAAELAKARLDAIRRGSDLLTELAGPEGPKRLRAALAPGIQWFLLRFNGQPIGFKAQAEGPAHRKEREGVQVRSWTMHRFPGKNPLVQSETLFVADGLVGEHWEAGARMGSPAKPVVETETGSLRGRILSCEITRNGRPVPIEREIPAQVSIGESTFTNVHLPRALGQLLPRLVDLGRPGAYSFLTYNVRSDRFDQRTFRVIGADTLTIDGKAVQAVEAADSPADDADAVRLWLDAKGNILRMWAPGGLTLERAGEADVLKAFPDARKLIDAEGGLPRP